MSTSFGVTIFRIIDEDFGAKPDDVVEAQEILHGSGDVQPSVNVNYFGSSDRSCDEAYR
jgi:hypothetical protein